MVIDLSVLICSTHTRWNTFGRAIQEQVWRQHEALPEADQKRIEILMLTDNKRMMLGQKRNVMVDMAQGRYVMFIDDDDRIESDMFATILAETARDVDVITYQVAVSLNGQPARICRYSKDFPHDRNMVDGYERLPNHLCAVKKEIAQRVSFPNIPYGEDSAYSKLLHAHLNTEHAIDRVLYHYDYSTETTEAQEHIRATLRDRRAHAATAIVDVVIMSKAATLPMREMTQRTINSCITGANSLPVHVTVIEQIPGRVYHYARTILIHDPFNYNRFANMGAQMGSAEWIMVANNDLIFHDGWLHSLLVADHPVVSPKCPNDRRQSHITENTRGYENAVHFSGWCFMLKREVWRKIGGFDDCVRFWCSDDATLEQLRAIDVVPMLVPDSKVTHLMSETLHTESDQDELTWGQVAIFNRKYQRNKFAHDARYLLWKQRNSVEA